MPAAKPTARSIIRSLEISRKKHLFITGSRSIGKSTLAQQLLPLLADSPVPGFATHVTPQVCVTLQDLSTGRSGTIGQATQSTLPGLGMQCAEDGFLSVGISALQAAAEAPCAWVVLDELGYLESNCAPFCASVEALLETKRVLAVLRKQDTLFLNRLRSRDDVFLLDLDVPYPAVGCVVMASGLGRRFGSNKLLADFGGQPLIHRAITLAGSGLFAADITVTRHTVVQALCNALERPVLLHSEPNRCDTVRLGLSALLQQCPQLQACLFLPGDQPLFSAESLSSLLLLADPHAIWRACSSHGAGSPVLFGRDYFDELLHLTKGGGSEVLLCHPDAVRLLPCPDVELLDADTPAALAELEKSLHHF